MRILHVMPASGRFGGSELVAGWTADAQVAAGLDAAVVRVLPGPGEPPAGARPEGWPGRAPCSEVEWDDRDGLRAAAEGMDIVLAHRPPAAVRLAAAGVPAAVPTAWICQEPPRDLFPEVMLRTPRPEAPPLPAFARLVAGLRARGPLHLVDVVRRRLGGGPGAPAVDAAASREEEVAAVRSLAAVWANSPWTADRVREAYHLEAPVLEPGVPPPAPGAADGPAPAPVARHVGGLHPLKNAIGSVEALAAALGGEGGCPPDTVLEVAGAGDGAQRRAVERRAAALGVAGRVRFTGAPADAEDLYRGARVILYPALDEPFGLVPVEAGLRGLPVIVHRDGGPSHTVVDGVTGVQADFAAGADRGAAGSALAGLLRDRDRAAELGAAGRTHCRTWTLEAWMERLEHRIAEVVGP